MSILGTRVERTEDPALLTVGGTYIADMPLPGEAWVVYVRSPIAHGRILSVDTSDAMASDGVLGVITADDIDLAPAPPSMKMLDQRFVRPFLATGTVRFVGEAVAAVVAETYAQAVDAAELVVIDIDPLPPITDALVAADDAAVLHADAGTNVCFTVGAPASDGFFDGCEVVSSVDIVNQRINSAPIEPRASAAWWSDDGRLHVHACSQNAHGTQAVMARVYGMDLAMVHSITPDVGGGFGAKHGGEPEEVLLPWLARRFERPMRWVETRTESMLTLPHGRGQFHRATIGGTRDGRIQAYRLDLVQDAGAYPIMGAMLPFMTRMMAAGTYDIERVEYHSRSVVTTTGPVGAFRGAGRPEATAAVERAIDVFAADIAMDPAEVRRRNLVAPERFPFTTATGVTYDTGDYLAALELVLSSAGYDALRSEQQARRISGDPVQLGIGVSTYVEVTNPFSSGEFGSIELTPGGGALVRTGSSAHGQGHHTVFAMIASERTGIPIDRIEVRHGDTDDVPRGGGTGGSKSLQVGGSAVAIATDQLIESARVRAADRLEAALDDVVLDPAAGRFHVAGTPTRSVHWSDLSPGNDDDDDVLASFTDFKPTAATFPFGAHVSVVEVDTETGAVRVLRHISVDDAGRILNPLIVDGQVHGGVASGIAQALLEEMVYDGDGNPVTANFADYAVISAAELPSFERIAMETLTPLNPLGVKGIGEAGTIGATPAVHNAVVDALAHLGVRHLDMPLKPERIWSALQETR